MKKNKSLRNALIFSAIMGASLGQCLAAEKTADVYLLNDNAGAHGIGKKIGTVTFQDGVKGLIVRPHLTGLPEGEHGFHIHENPSCDAVEKEGKWVPGMAAGGHLDPQQTGKHLGPYGNGHLGDLPVLIVDNHGNGHLGVVAPRLKVADLQNRTIMIHAGGDNYSDEPKPMGGGGARIACGVIK